MAKATARKAVKKAPAKKARAVAKKPVARKAAKTVKKAAPRAAAKKRKAAKLHASASGLGTRNLMAQSHFRLSKTGGRVMRRRSSWFLGGSIGFIRLNLYVSLTLRLRVDYDRRYGNVPGTGQGKKRRQLPPRRGWWRARLWGMDRLELPGRIGKPSSNAHGRD